ncbi:50S ribosomal protein L10 [Eisenibacter elegans]|jgi:large subunit ribosomal protein L10|uniref:50S ribosomal protein L10 n=1 Tax=Eisenibacter elegans TaxID=997 RepID=UPI000425ED47|nr:50S ribosomal protein L10 [Eisenibacter elegans]
MTREDKAQVIEELKEKFANTTYFYIANAEGMTVEQINSFRRACFEKGIEYKVYKNTLIKKALESLETDYTPFNEKVLKGVSGVMFTNEAGNLPARVLKEFRKGANKPVLKGASIDSSFYYGDDSLDALTKIKSREELLADLAGMLMSPAQNLASALQSSGAKLAGALEAYAKKLEEGSAQ